MTRIQSLATAVAATRIDILTAFQPIVDIQTGGLLGHEALSSGVDGNGQAHSPRVLFADAKEAGSLLELERSCWTSALRNLESAGDRESAERLIFINILPEVIELSSELPSLARTMLECAGWRPQQLVIEITESTRIEDYGRFLRALELYQQQGFQFAIDDAGSGHSGLQTIAELRPRYIKVDKALIRGVAHGDCKAAIVDAFIGLAHKLNSNLIAEGVENPADLLALRRMGVQYAQGYFLGYPASTRDQPDSLALALLESAPSHSLYHPPHAPVEPERLINAGMVAQNAPCAASMDEVRAVRPLITRDREAGGIALVDDGVPVGLLMKQRLFQMLGHQYGYSLYIRRAVRDIADMNPLILPETTPIEEVSSLAMARSPEALYDDVIVTRDGTYLGLLPVHRLLDLMTSLRLESARSANPLTGLPGNLAIEREIRLRLECGQTFGLMYIDLDEFKAFNDTHGFAEGDAAIRTTARVITESAAAFGGASSFVGHIGGDDFVALVDLPQLAASAAQMIATFDQAVRELHTPEEMAAGCMWTRTRKGSLQRVGLLSITIAATRAFAGAHYAALVDAAREVKQLAKSRDRIQRPGSIFLLDRRGEEHPQHADAVGDSIH